MENVINKIYFVILLELLDSSYNTSSYVLNGAINVLVYNV